MNQETNDLEIIPSGQMEAMERASIDVQICTAKK